MFLQHLNVLHAVTAILCCTVDLEPVTVHVTVCFIGIQGISRT